MLFKIVVVALLAVIVLQLAEVLYRLPRRNAAKEAMERDGIAAKPADRRPEDGS
ncbi:hypothetical protein SAMN02799624_01112 [Paenibacillus sp. UNC496MF]|uniref:hypothetical protein n=1 Tax=Paenibacillus sp. UNC496MF TaxID=1502753 RepID=UPI0008ECE018|nr:hypothetical protein [Paenibacillus sp. UNC496MF]SFI50832.1 hypothetical protein SAMN02799624_01112 [Paenibacillus sp. UNC496MF]